MSKPSLYNYLTAYGLWAADNFPINKPALASLYMSILHLSNRLKWPEQFGIPRHYMMHLMGISSRAQYYEALDLLEKCGFVQIIEKSTNQNKATIISLSVPTDYTGGRSGRHIAEQSSNGTIDKTSKEISINIENKEELFQIFLKNVELIDFLKTKNLATEKKVREFLDNSFAAKKNTWQTAPEMFSHFINWLKYNEKTVGNSEIKLNKALRR